MRRTLARGLVVWLVALAASAALAGTAAARTRPVVILVFQPLAGSDDGWLGEGIAETLYVAAQGTPALLPMDRTRVAQALRSVGGEVVGAAATDAKATDANAAETKPPDAKPADAKPADAKPADAKPVDAKTALAVARTLKAESVLYGDYQRTPDGGVTITPKVMDVKTGESQTLEAVSGKPGQILDAQAEVIQVYAKGLKLGLKPDEIQKLVAAAKPTTNLTAFEAYAKARRSALRGGQEGNEGAAELLARAVELDPTFALAHYHLGVVHMALGNRWKAAAQFRASTQVDANLADPYKALGDIFMSSPRRLYDQAIEAYQKAVALRPHYAEAQVGLGDARAAKGDSEGAITHYQKALALDPLNARVHYALGKIQYSEKGLYYEAVTAYKKAVDLDPFFVDARMGLGEIYEDKGLYKDAIAEYKKVIEADPRHTGARYNLALAYEKVDPKESIVQWEKYIDLAGQVASEKEWVDTARQHLKKLRDKHPQ